MNRKQCTIPDCEKLTRSGKCPFCEMHYYRNYLNGSPLKLKREQYVLNDNLFDDTWDNNKAWLLGILWSDGWIKDNSIGIKSKDIEIIENIKSITGTTQKIKTCFTNNKEYYMLSLCSKIMSNKLRQYGIHENKSLTIKYPTCLPIQYFGSFLRGIIDGDGTISLYKAKANKSLRFAVSFITGSQDFKNSLSAILTSLTINHCVFTRTQFRKNGKLEDNWFGNDIYTITINKRDSLYILYKLLYQSANSMCLSRKKDIFDKWLATPKPKIGRIKNDNLK